MPPSPWRLDVGLYSVASSQLSMHSSVRRLSSRIGKAAGYSTKGFVKIAARHWCGQRHVRLHATQKDIEPAQGLKASPCSDRDDAKRDNSNRPTLSAGSAAMWKQLVALCTCVAVICSVDRAAISVAILPMSAAFLWDDSTKGLVSSSFFLGYTFANLVGGPLATRFPPKLVLAWGVGIWSVCTMVTPAAAASGSLTPLIACRVVMGLGEGVTFPCIQNLVAGNVPHSGKPRSLALVYSGIQIGTIISLLSAPVIIRNLEWPAVFYVFGSVGFVWLIFWLPLAHDRTRKADSAQLKMYLPSSCRGKETPSYHNDTTAVSGDQSNIWASNNGNRVQVPWKQIMTNKSFLAVFIAHSGWGFGHSICYAWLPAYYYSEYGMQIKESAWLSALPWVCTVLLTNIGGSVADVFVERGTCTRLQARVAMQLVGSIGPAACLLYLASAANGLLPHVSLPGAVALMCMALGLGGLTCSGFASNHQDLSVRYTGVLFGITNAASSLSGTFSTYATGRILDLTHSWEMVFSIVAAVYISSALVYAAWASTDNQFDSQWSH